MKASQSVDQLSEPPGAVSRRGICRLIGGASAALMLGSVAHADAAPDIDVDLLNFALNLEYLEAEFYSVVATGRHLEQSDIDGVGAKGYTHGGSKIDFTNRALYDLAAELHRDELEHVRFLRSALGSHAVAKPQIELDALGMGYSNDQEFLTLARALEDLGASAYRTAARLLKDKAHMDAVAGILATEAYHAGNLRAHVVYANFTVPPLDPLDQPPLVSRFFPTNERGFVVSRTPAEVIEIVRGKSAHGGRFFPSGLNGGIR